MHLLSLGSVLLTVAFLVNVGPGIAWQNCARICGPAPLCLFPTSFPSCQTLKWQHGQCMKNCEWRNSCVNCQPAGYSCSPYDHFPQDCGRDDTRVFHARLQCCACGGGRLTRRPTTRVTRRPTPPVTRPPTPPVTRRPTPRVTRPAPTTTAKIPTTENISTNDS